MIVVYALLLVLLYTQDIASQSVTVQLSNNVVQTASIGQGGTNYYYFDVQNVQNLLFRRAIPPIFITAAICSQPASSSNSQDAVPSLEMYISTSDSNTLPGPGKGDKVADSEYGHIAWNSSGTEARVWMSVTAPTLNGQWSGNWTFEIGASTSQSLHTLYHNDDITDTSPSLSLDDTDRNNALFLSNIYKTTPPNSTIIMTASIPTELSYSSCAALLYKMPNYSVNTTLTTRGPTNDTRQQFMVANLTQDTTYKAYMMQSSGSSNGMTLPITVYTKTDSNCRLIYDLPFCNQVAYSVPVGQASYSTSDIWNISSAYDKQAADLFKPFDVALTQFNCETTQYSLVRNCTDCYRDYKTWLCSVTIPRCTDSSSSSDLSQGTDNVKAAPAIRDISVNASRNSWIDSTMEPGEWTELLPCIDLCYHVVQSCPPFMQFYCPQGDLAAVQYGYWQTGNATVNGTLYNFDVNNPTCNRMGVNASLLTISGATHISTLNLFLTVSTSLLLLLVLF
ncbi:hypothetical protein K501DRAFT_255101 [Backusella circina FSU 941]|nr:hypothetical protein K501DRAFT_255101 [Backusella circina FSU 941]